MQCQAPFCPAALYLQIRSEVLYELLRSMRSGVGSCAKGERAGRARARKSGICDFGATVPELGPQILPKQNVGDVSEPRVRHSYSLRRFRNQPTCCMLVTDVPAARMTVYCGESRYSLDRLPLWGCFLFSRR